MVKILTHSKLIYILNVIPTKQGLGGDTWQTDPKILQKSKEQKNLENSWTIPHERCTKILIHFRVSVNTLWHWLKHWMTNSSWLSTWQDLESQWRKHQGILWDSFQRRLSRGVDHPECRWRHPMVWDPALNKKKVFISFSVTVDTVWPANSHSHTLSLHHGGLHALTVSQTEASFLPLPLLSVSLWSRGK